MTTQVSQVLSDLDISSLFLYVCVFLAVTESEKPALTGLVPWSLLVRSDFGIGSGRLLLLLLCLCLVGRLLL